MKNKKGMTIAELIVSIVLVSVACIYFFQTIVSINKLYSTVNEDTNDYLHRLYLLRLADAYKEENNNMNNFNSDLANYDLPSEYLDNSGKLAINYDNGTFRKDGKSITFFALDDNYSDSGGGDSQDNENQDNDDDTTVDNTTDDNTDTNNSGENDTSSDGSNGGNNSGESENENDSISDDIATTINNTAVAEQILKGNCKMVKDFTNEYPNLSKYDLDSNNGAICYYNSISNGLEVGRNLNNEKSVFAYITSKGYAYCYIGISQTGNSCKRK